MWLPDVYEGAPTSVTLFIGTAPKIAYFALTLRLLAHGLAGTESQWSQMLAALAVMTLVVGNVVAIVQTNLKRMLAYSTIANVGFIVLGFVPARPTATRRRSITPWCMCWWRSVPSCDPAGECQGLRGGPARGLQGPVPARSAAGAGHDVLMFSTAGVPPLVGFWAKLRIFQVLWETHHLWWWSSRPPPRWWRLLLPARDQAHVLR